MISRTVFLCFQIRSLDPSRFVNPATRQIQPAGKMPDERMRDIDNALRMTLSL